MLSRSTICLMGAYLVVLKIDGSNFPDEFTHMSVGSIDSSTPRLGGGESFKGFNFEAPEDQQIEYGFTRDVSLSNSRENTP